MSSGRPPYPVLVGSSTPIPGPYNGEISRVYLRHFEFLRNYAATLVGRDEAEDVVHDALMKLYRQLETKGLPGDDDALFARLTVMVQDQALDVLKHRKVESRAMQLISGARAAVRRWTKTERRAEDGEITREIDAAMSRLRPSQRRACVLIRQSEFKTRQASELMQVTESTVRAHLVRAMDALQDDLTQRGLEPGTRKQRRNTP